MTMGAICSSNCVVATTLCDLSRASGKDILFLKQVWEGPRSLNKCVSPLLPRFCSVKV